MNHALLVPLVFFVGCAASTHATQVSVLGTARSEAELLTVIDQPGQVTVETITACEWMVDRKGLINLDHPTARQAGLVDGPEPIKVYFHVLRHPTLGTFIVDTGVERALRDEPELAAIRGLVAQVMKMETMRFMMPLGDWLAKEGRLDGVFLTHLHLDHVSGMPDVPASTPVYAGPGEPGDHAFLNLFVQPNIDRALAGKGALQEWPYQRVPDGQLAVVDVFGDGMVWAISVPGHTSGSTAYLVRTPSGPVLMTGDASHTRWGWEHDVEPGEFSTDKPRSAKSLAALRGLVAAHPAISVRLGHQE